MLQRKTILIFSCLVSFVIIIGSIYKFKAHPYLADFYENKIDPILNLLYDYCQYILNIVKMLIDIAGEAFLILSKIIIFVYRLVDASIDVVSDWVIKVSDRFILKLSSIKNWNKKKTKLDLIQKWIYQNIQYLESLIRGSKCKKWENLEIFETIEYIQYTSRKIRRIYKYRNEKVCGCWEILNPNCWIFIIFRWCDIPQYEIRTTFPFLMRSILLTVSIQLFIRCLWVGSFP
ncbi:uncharacterized protein LOC111639322 [Centruroides sculpturatus]|uniref:uncharacterized protein LOC111639322 n=1 Tax=Centruroides sculpturatus TaxID=218467 RepID=UPI000C6EAA5A|nr:uncharacterized protein LOC111639322 [Centruroides sculpturatus]